MRFPQAHEIVRRNGFVGFVGHDNIFFDERLLHDRLHDTVLHGSSDVHGHGVSCRACSVCRKCRGRSGGRHRDRRRRGNRSCDENVLSRFPQFHLIDLMAMPVTHRTTTITGIVPAWQSGESTRSPQAKRRWERR